MISESLTDRLKDPSLLPATGLIAGRWVAKIAGGARFAIKNPANGEVIADLPDMCATEAIEAIEAAYEAQHPWAQKTANERSSALQALHDLILANAEDLATILTSEMGKPFAQALGEVRYGASYIKWFAEEARRVYGDVLPGHQADKRIVVLKQSVGVVGLITPWNFPNAMIARKIAPALAA